MRWEELFFVSCPPKTAGMTALTTLTTSRICEQTTIKIYEEDDEQTDDMRDHVDAATTTTTTAQTSTVLYRSYW